MRHLERHAQWPTNVWPRGQQTGRTVKQCSLCDGSGWITAFCKDCQPVRIRCSCDAVATEREKDESDLKFLGAAVAALVLILLVILR